MKNTIKKLLSIILSVVMLIGIAPLTGIDFSIDADAKNISDYAFGDIIEFGSYPQTRVTDAVLISSLNSLSKTWISYGYYSQIVSGYFSPGDWMKYADVTYDGNKYRAVTFSQYRPYSTGVTSSSPCSSQDDNGYYTDTVYWFKYEPLKWRVLNAEEGLVMCETLIDTQTYNNTYYYKASATSTRYAFFQDSTCATYANDYAASSIRDWLNNDFYNTAFTSREKSGIGTTTLDNSCYSSLYPEFDSETTYDKIFLLSYDEAILGSLGKAQGTDYAKCQGLSVDNNGNSDWYLRSSHDESRYIRYVDDRGDRGGYYDCYTSVNGASTGIRPALKFNQESESAQSFDISTLRLMNATASLDGNTIVITADEGAEQVNVYPSTTDGKTVTIVTEGTPVRLSKGGTYYLLFDEYHKSGNKAESTITIDGTLSFDIKFIFPVENDGHTYAETRKEPTCTEKGSVTYTCSVCGDTYTDEIPANGHDFRTEVVEATCTSEGYTIHICNVCGYRYVDTYVPVTGHTYGNWILEKEPNCTESGSRYKICDCGQTVKEAISPLGHTPGEWQRNTEPTCTENGYKTYLCERCGDRINEVIPATGHVLGELISEKEATCTGEGHRKYICSVCEEEVTETIPAKGHTKGTLTASKAATCVLDGYKKYNCSVCGVDFTETIPALGHTKGELVATKQPTCSEYGYSIYVCSVCGDRFVDDYTSPTLHNYGHWIIEKHATCTENGKQYRECICGEKEERAIYATGHIAGTLVSQKAPTCKAEGYEKYICALCGEEFTKTLPATGHTKGTLISTTAASCTENGYNRYRCSTCSAQFDEIIYAFGHTPGELVSVTAPTCTQSGYTVYKCKTCGAEFEVYDIAPLGHSFGEWIVEKVPTCTKSGSRYRICSVCGEKQTETISALGHLPGEVLAKKDPTCTENGYIRYRCSVCGEAYEKVLPALGHMTEEIKEQKEPTCLDSGYVIYICTDCGNEHKVIIPAKGHVPGKVIKVVESTCTEAGYTVYECAVCGKKYVSNHIGALGHNYGEWKTEKQPTCTENGLRYRECSCGDRIEQVIPAVGHTPGRVVGQKAATCEESGFVTYNCSVCGENYTVNFDALGHKYGDNTVSKDPTCTESGYITYTCARCGKEKTDVISPLGHKQGELLETKDATCTESGYKKYKCTRCGDTYTVNFAPLGHSAGNWQIIREADYYSSGLRVKYCSRCGEIIAEEVIPKLIPDPIRIYVDDLSMFYKETKNLSAEFDSDRRFEVEYFSSNEDVVTVDSEGNVTATGRGNATITISVYDEYGYKYTEKCNVEVTFAWWQWIIYIVLFGWIWY